MYDANSFHSFCVDADNYVGESLINAIFEARKNDRTVRYVETLRTTYLAPLTVPYQRIVLQFNF